MEEQESELFINNDNSPFLDNFIIPESSEFITNFVKNNNNEILNKDENYVKFIISGNMKYLIFALLWVIGAILHYLTRKYGHPK